MGLLSRESPKPRLGGLDRRALGAYGVVVAIALAVRLIALAKMPAHHDESIIASFAARLADGHAVRYDPTYHGPLQYYVVAFAFRLFGTTDFVARLMPALIGSFLVAVPALMTRQLGRVGAWTTALMLAVSPSMIYISRFGREDIYIVAFTLLLVALAGRFFQAPRQATLVAIAAVLALSFATKETTFITVFIVMTFAGAVTVASFVPRWRNTARTLVEPVRTAIHRLPIEALVWAVVAFIIVFVLMFTEFFVNLDGLRAGIFDGIRYWWSQHPVRRGDQPGYFYVALLGGYEWPILGFAAVGAVRVLRRPTLLTAFVLWAAVATVALYSWAGEKFAWLVVHPLLPLVVLGGLGAQALWDRRGLVRSLVLRAGLAIILVYGLVAGCAAAIAHPADPRELLVSFQTADDVKQIRDEIVALRRRDPSLRIVIDSSDAGAWPWGWYLHDIPALYGPLEEAPAPDDADVMVVMDANRQRISDDGYTTRRFKARVAWMPDYGNASPLDWARWLAQRRTWSPTLSTYAWLYVRDDQKLK